MGRDSSHRWGFPWNAASGFSFGQKRALFSPFSGNGYWIELRLHFQKCVYIWSKLPRANVLNENTVVREPLTNLALFKLPFMANRCSRYLLRRTPSVHFTLFDQQHPLWSLGSNPLAVVSFVWIGMCSTQAYFRLWFCQKNAGLSPTRHRMPRRWIWPIYNVPTAMMQLITLSKSIMSYAWLWLLLRAICIFTFHRTSRCQIQNRLYPKDLFALM